MPAARLLGQALLWIKETSNAPHASRSSACRPAALADCPAPRSRTAARVPHLQYEQLLKKNEQMYALLALCVALCPAAGKGLDENVLMQVGWLLVGWSVDGWVRQRSVVGR